MGTTLGAMMWMGTPSLPPREWESLFGATMGTGTPFGGHHRDGDPPWVHQMDGDPLLCHHRDGGVGVGHQMDGDPSWGYDVDGDPSSATMGMETPLGGQHEDENNTAWG